MSKILGINIRKYREKNSLTQAQLGAKLGLAESTISLYESGKREPDLNTVQLFADFFNVSVDYLLGRTDNPKPPVYNNDDEFQSTPREELLIFYKKAGELSPESLKLIEEQIEHLHRLERESWERKRTEKENK